MECICGHPIVNKKDRAIVDWKGEHHYLHTECVPKYFKIHSSGTPVPTLEYLEFLKNRRALEKKAEVVEPTPEPTPAPKRTEYECKKCGYGFNASEGPKCPNCGADEVLDADALRLEKARENHICEEDVKPQEEKKE